MKILSKCSSLFILVLCLPFYICAQGGASIEVAIPSIQDEATSIWSTINDITFLEGQGYRIHLPDDKVFSDLIQKSKEGKFSGEDFPTIYQALESGIYNKQVYAKAKQKTITQVSKLEKMLDSLNEIKAILPWQLNVADNYRIVFTLYGTGGSYDVSGASVILFTDKEGNFMNYKDPSNTIIHEIVHIGIEDSLVQKYDLTHGNKERLVDSIVKLLFSSDLPDYKLQNMGDSRISSALNSLSDLKKIEEVLGRL